MPGVIGVLVAMVLVSFPLWQFTEIVLTVVFALTMGIIVRFIVLKLGRKEIP